MTCDTPPTDTPSCRARTYLSSAVLRHRWHQTRAGYAHIADTHLVQVPETVGSIIAEAMR